MTTPNPDMDRPPERSWWGRNWKWVVPVGCLVPLLACGGLMAAILMVVFGALRSSEVYTEAVARAKANEQVRAQLGEPIQPGFMVNGNIQINNQSGSANLSIPISGPKKSATIYVVATKAAGKWEYTTLEVAPEGSAERINLRAPATY